MSNGYQQVDSGTKMIHLGKNTTSRIISKGIAAGFSQNTYRGQVSAHRKATNARNFTNCDSLLIGNQCGAHTVPYIEAKNATAQFEHEATTSKISDDQKFYVMQRGIPEEEAIALIVNGFVKDVIQQLPMEFAVEAQKLIGISPGGQRRLGTRTMGADWLRSWRVSLIEAHAPTDREAAGLGRIASRHDMAQSSSCLTSGSSAPTAAPGPIRSGQRAGARSGFSSPAWSRRALSRHCSPQAGLHGSGR